MAWDLKGTLGGSPVAARQALAAALLARWNGAEAQKLQLYSGTAPVWSANTASQIASSLLRAPRRTTPPNLQWAANTAVATQADPHFLYASPTQAYGTAFPDYLFTRTPFLTGGASQSAYWPLRVSFYYDGQSFELFGKPFTSSAFARLRVNGQLVTEGMQAIGTGLTPGSGYYFRCNLGSAAMRLIELEIDGSDPSFGGIKVEPTATIQRGPSPSLRLASLCDSIGAGATDYSRYTSWVGVLQELLGGDSGVYNLGIGGTGYTVGMGTTDFLTRVPDVIASGADVVVLQGEQNDGTVANATLQANALAVVNAVRAGLPKAIVFMVGAYSAGTPTAVKMGHDGALRAAAAAGGAHFISLLDPSDATVSGSGVPNFVGGTYYTEGDEVIDPNGVPWSRVTAGTAASTFSTTEQASWRPTSVFFGTGRVGATTGNGNADVMVNSADAVHPTVRGSKALGWRIFRGMETHLRTIVNTGPALG